MNFLSIARSVGGFLLGSAGKAEDAKSIAKTGLDIIDGLHYSGQEKASDIRAIGQLVIEHSKVIADENTERSRGRRAIAQMIIRVWLTFLLGACIVWSFNKAYAEFILLLIGLMTFAVSSIVVCYFGYYGFTQYKKAKAGK